jgi:rhodanese-related sulfurtransferase
MPGRRTAKADGVRVFGEQARSRTAGRSGYVTLCVCTLCALFAVAGLPGAAVAKPPAKAAAKDAAKAPDPAKASEKSPAAGTPALEPVDISPEGVRELQKRGEPFLLVDAGASSGSAQPRPEPLRVIYYTTSPSSAAARRAVERDRQVENNGVPNSNRSASRRLTGTPLEWQRLGLPFTAAPLPTKPIRVAPRVLSEAIQEGAPLQVVDLRPTDPGHRDDSATAFPGAMRLMPHQIDTESSRLSKQRWTVLIDDGNRISEPIAEKLFQQGYALTAVLDGGYPAWIRNTDR